MSSLNLLALDKGVLDFLSGPQGWKVVSLDLKSIEPKCIAHFSQCPNYMRLFGPEANPNHDVYIYVGMGIPEFAEKFAPYYDIDNPDKEKVDYIKKEFHEERQICKKFHLSAVYGAGAPLIHNMLEQDGVFLSLRNVQKMHRSYWNMFSVVKKYTRYLQAEWARNRGYIITGRGTPKPINQQDASKDILNRMIQTTAHQYAMRWFYHIKCVREENNINARPLLLDLHDSTTWTCPADEVENVDFMLQEGLRRLNEELNLSVVIEGKTKIGDNLGIIA